LQGRLWRGSSLGAHSAPTLPSGFAALDAELPGGGWPLGAVTEKLSRRLTPAQIRRTLPM
ncbi:hypothetical protein ABTL08_19180, partial [Acinetobacter baumannii]